MKRAVALGLTHDLIQGVAFFKRSLGEQCLVDQVIQDALLIFSGVPLAMLGGVSLGRLILPRVSRQFFIKLVLGMLALFGLQFVSFP